MSKNYTLVLTHDVDFLCLRNYKFFSKTSLKFIKDCLFINMVRVVKKDMNIFDYCQSFLWGLSYPAVQLGIIPDPWEINIKRIRKLEKKYRVRSTFFFIPYKNKAGFINEHLPAPQRRQAKYDIQDYKELLKCLEINGWEVGIHGINAHINSTDAAKELSVFKNILQDKKKWGIRMHWLYQTPQLWRNLKKAGYYYDATYGSNEEIFFDENKYDLFKKDGIWILPLNIQDGTLLAKWRKNLSQKNAWFEIEKLLDFAKKRSAVVTVLWHNSSFGPPCYWGKVYEKILKKAKQDNADIKRAVDAVDSAEANQKYQQKEVKY